MPASAGMTGGAQKGFDNPDPVAGERLLGGTRAPHLVTPAEAGVHLADASLGVSMDASLRWHDGRVRRCAQPLGGRPREV
jgi:hypothetical protein